MTYPQYTQQALSRYTLPRLKRIAAELGVTPTLDKGFSRDTRKLGHVVKFCKFNAQKY